ncbi:MAG: hexosaminidase [Candidatus Sumerlaeota bacterium]|nr:hexosaminidase [Candidatus Sumerlaeota bacterium]
MRWFLLSSLIMMIAACGSRAPQSIPADAVLAGTPNIVPVPVRMELGQGAFVLGAGTRVLWQRGNDDARDAAFFLSHHLEEATSSTLSVGEAPFLRRPDNSILLTNAGVDEEIGEEGYRLSVAPDGITIRAQTHRGFVWGVQSLRQMLPPSAPVERNTQIALAVVEIEDQPRFPWRGMHLDVCRHFLPLEFVKEYIDLLSYYKFNTFHWHLTEDQGWRIQIDAFPKLTEIGAWRYEASGKHGGYYTKDQVREVVAYARERGITIVPEIEMPGHALAALAAYPEFSCTGGPFEVASTWGVFDDVYCAGKDETFDFLETVLDEVMELFPGEYIHVGGDECPKKRWETCPDCQARIAAEGLKDEHELQSYFIHRIEEYINAKGRRLIGWDEILEGGLAPNATVMSWRGIKGGIAAAQQRHDVVMTPYTHLYFDYRQEDKPGELGATYTKRVIDDAHVYTFEPIPEELTAEEAKHVLGAQANVWSEQLHSGADVEYMVLPRMCALSEVVWSPASHRDRASFETRMETHFQRFAAWGVNYRRP